jgi:ribosomal protein S18 acetylase RimI-like enzyme
MIRPITPEDTEALLALADSTELFAPGQLGELRQLLTDSFSQTGDTCPFWLTDEDDGLVGLAYCEPERLTSGTWNLQLIGIHPKYQRQGRGANLLLFVEQTLAARGTRLLLVETAGTPDFEPVRAFYRKNGYDEEACIREFYAEGVDKIVFRKALSVQVS